MDWLDSVAGPQYVPAILWTLAALAALIVVLLLVKLFRRASTGAFVAGGRNRKTRLSVMDATAVDSHRRLVLVRRDDVEHLLLIGGANDLVVEQNIRLVAPTRRPPPPTPAPQAGEPAAHAPPRPAPPPAPQPAQRAPATAVAQRHPASEIKAAPRPMVQPRPAPPQERPAVAPKPAASPAPPPRPVPPAADDIDDALLQELEVTLDNERGRTTRSTEASLEDEMTRLLGELSNPKK
ncbi:MAG: flagellar biosynthetic protein FliO [Rhizobiales bacterium]|nr:flagellar biosynthetic protein FliO [Hyphomicrobiales bacterium]